MFWADNFDRLWFLFLVDAFQFCWRHEWLVDFDLKKLRPWMLNAQLTWTNMHNEKKKRRVWSEGECIIQENSCQIRSNWNWNEAILLKKMLPKTEWKQSLTWQIFSVRLSGQQISAILQVSFSYWWLFNCYRTKFEVVIVFVCLFCLTVFTFLGRTVWNIFQLACAI